MNSYYKQKYKILEGVMTRSKQYL